MPKILQRRPVCGAADIFALTHYEKEFPLAPFFHPKAAARRTHVVAATDVTCAVGVAEAIFLRRESSG
jgi:hypothetical protein